MFFFRSYLRASRGLMDQHNCLHRNNADAIDAGQTAAMDNANARPKLSPRDILGFAWQIAKGMK